MTRSRMVFGLTFVAIGTVLLLEQADVLSAWPVFADWWPAVIILAGVAQALLRPRNPVGGTIVGLVGVALLLGTLDVADTVRLVWPVLLIGLGLWLITRRSQAGTGSGGSVPAAGHDTAARTDGREPSTGRHAASVPVPVVGDVTAVFDDRQVRTPPGPWSGQAVTTVFGDVGLDLSDAVIAERARLQVTTIFGDVDVTIPPTWRVTVSGPELFGNVSVPAVDILDGAPVLHLQVVTIFGDVVIRQAAPAAV